MDWGTYNFPLQKKETNRSFFGKNPTSKTILIEEFSVCNILLSSKHIILGPLCTKYYVRMYA